jgi:cytochrome c nitrite reductase small subunit
MRHSLAFTFGGFPEPIRITPRNRRVTEAQCRTCHAGLVHDLDEAAGGREDVACTSCHADVGHAK